MAKRIASVLVKNLRRLFGRDGNRRRTTPQETAARLLSVVLFGIYLAGVNQRHKLRNPGE